jgi:hypothetical protein
VIENLRDFPSYFPSHHLLELRSEVLSWNLKGDRMKLLWFNKVLLWDLKGDERKGL